MYRRIMVAIDESARSAHVVEDAADLAKRLSAALRIVHVVDMGWLPLAPELAIDIDTIAKARRAAGERVLAAAREHVRATGIAVEIKLLETNAPTQHIAAAIADEAAHWPADVVVLGTHGRRGAERLLLGSVADGVARLSAVPILLVPRPGGGV